MVLQRSSRPLARFLERAASAEAQNLQLPFLCPLLLPSRSQHRSASSSAKKSSSSSLSDSARTLQSHHVAEPIRPLRAGHVQQQRASFVTDSSKHATATASSYPSSGEDPIPFGPPPTNPHSELAERSSGQMPALRGFDVNSSPLILNDTPITSVGRYTISMGVGGDLNEIHQTLHACLQVGRFERAVALVRRLNENYKPDAPGLLAAHTDYLREATLDVIRSKDAARLEELLEWFEHDVRRKKVPLTEMLLGYMIHACMQVPNDVPKPKGIRRLYKLAADAGLRRETESVVAELQAAVEVCAKRLPGRSRQR